eukprot:GILI01014286.1.p1 GENE.GILI01014286.1~~GILI01014286.1.p1  ORF type:complete len:247 (-),score=70.35 GILI01014286.1:187-927(-)
MTTAHRPTFNARIADGETGQNRLIQPIRGFSARDLPAHTKLKYRAPGQGSDYDLKGRDLRSELEEKERQHFASKKRGRDEEHLYGSAAGQKRLAVTDNPYTQDADDDDDDEEDDRDKRQRKQDSDAEDSNSDSDSDSDDDSDDEEELLRLELEKIKKEREEEARRKELERQEEEQRRKGEEMVVGNPLLHLNNGAASRDSFAISKRWDEDVVFRNQAKTEMKAKKRFINDTVRSDFHRKFLHKFIQ